MDKIRIDQVVVSEGASIFEMDEHTFESLKEDIKKNGIINPIKLVKKDGKPYLVDGRSRLYACLALGIKEIPFEWADDDNVSLEESIASANKVSL